MKTSSMKTSGTSPNLIKIPHKKFTLCYNLAHPVATFAENHKNMEKMMYGTDPQMDKKVDSPSETVRMEAAREGYGLDKLVHDPSVQVRIEVAIQKYGLDILKDDPDEHVRFIVEHVQQPKRKIVMDDTILASEIRYGFDPEKDALVDSPKVADRVRIAKAGYGLDVLVYDASPKVRCEVLKHHYGIHILKNDPH